MPRIIIIPDEGMSEDDREAMRARFTNGDGCRWCGGLHERDCPRIRKIVYHPSDDRQVREIEFWPEGEWNKSSVIFPEDLL